MQFKERFGKKMKERMEQKDIDTKEFAKRLFNYGSDSDLCNIPENKKSYDNCIRKVQKWLSGSDEPKNFDELEKICKILDCDSSYLFDDKPVVNFNNKKVAEWLGLDEIVVSNIKGYDNDIKLFMSLLVRANEYDNKFGDILHDFIEIMLILNQNSSYTTVTIENDITGEKESIKGTAAFDYILSAIKNMMEPIFYKVSVLGIDINRKKYNMELEKRNLEREKELERLLKEIMESTGKTKEEIFADIKKHKK